MSEFGITGQGELDLGLAGAAGPAARPPSAGAAARAGTAARPAPRPEGDGLADNGLADDWLNGDWADAGGEPGDWGDPETDPEDYQAWLAGLPAGVRADFLAGGWTGAGESIPAGFLHHVPGGPSGAGFAAGGVLDTMAPSPWLAEALTAATSGGHGELRESELIGVLCGWRRVSAWAAAGEAAAVLTLTRRRAAQAAAPGCSRLADHVTDEIAAALTLTGRSAGRLLDVASALGRLPDVHVALQHGEIDWPKACVFADELAVLDDDTVAAGIAARYLGRAGAGGWTTGQLRAALRRAVLTADPAAAGRRRAEARKDAEVRAWDESSGNAALAGRELPPAEVLAADARLTALAKWLQGRGAAGTISQLRAAVYTALLNGRPVTTLLDNLAAVTAAAEAAADYAAAGDAVDDGTANTTAALGGAAAGPDPAEDGADAVAAADSDAGDAAGGDVPGWPAVAGTVHLTMPLSAFAGGGEPGEVAGHGPVDAATSRDLAAMLAQNSSTRWCLTLTGPGGRAAGHACARAGPAEGQPVITWAAGLRARLQLLATGTCGHARQSPGYQPPASLRHLITVRQRTCSHPGCRRPAARCDLDHTVPYGDGGRTCECNIAPLCRHHHRCKQAQGWQLTQTRPGQMTWRTPSGRVYETVGDPY
jgi:hypothetical protein